MRLLGAFLVGLLVGVLLAARPAAAAMPPANRAPLVFRPVEVPPLLDRFATPAPTRSSALGIRGSSRSERRPPSFALAGTASWYCCTAGYGQDAVVAAAGPALRVGDWRGRIVTVCAGVCLRVRLVDWCGCYRGTARERLVDLAIGAVAALGLDPGRGLYEVKVRW